MSLKANPEALQKAAFVLGQIRSKSFPDLVDPDHRYLAFIASAIDAERSWVLARLRKRLEREGLMTPAIETELNATATDTVMTDDRDRAEATP